MRDISILSRKYLACLTLSVVLLSGIATPYASAVEYLSGPNNNYITTSTHSAYTPSFQLDASLNFGDRLIARLMSGSTETASGFYASIWFELTGMLPSFDFSGLSDGVYGMSGSIFDSMDAEVRSGIDGIFYLDRVDPILISTGTLSSTSGSITLDGVSISDLSFSSATLTYAWVGGATENGTIDLMGSDVALSGTITGLSPTSNYSLDITVRDLAGASTNISLGNYMTTSGPMDIVPPVLTLDSHTTGESITGATVLLTGSVTDAGVIDSVVVNGQTGSIVGNNWSLSYSSLISGSNPIEVIATDGAGNTGSVNISLIRIPNIPTSVSNTASGVDMKVIFTTDLVATWVVLYGTNSGSLDMSATGMSESWSHMIHLTSLTTGQTYYYQTYALAWGYSGGLSPLSSFVGPCATPTVTNGTVNVSTCAVSCNAWYTLRSNACVYLGWGSSLPTVPLTLTGKTDETQSGALKKEKKLPVCKVPLGERGIPKMLPEYEGVVFNDISSSAHRDSILKLAHRGVFRENPAGTFSPENLVSREVFILALGRLEWWDVKSYEWRPNVLIDIRDKNANLPYFLYATEKWILPSDVNRWFFPDRKITRVDLAIELTRAIEARTGEKLPTWEVPFTDISWFDVETRDAIKKIYALGITKWTTQTTYSPFEFVTREQLAVFLERLVCLDFVTDDTTSSPPLENTGSWETSTGEVLSGTTLPEKTWSWDVDPDASPIPKVDWVLEWKFDCSKDYSMEDDRKYVCKRGDITVGEIFCVQEKPTIVACKKGEWNVWEFESCKGGVHTRKVSCMIDDEVVSDAKCETSIMPSNTTSCVNSTEWVKISASSCSSEGIRTLDYACYNEWAQVSDSECNEPKPDSKVECDVIPLVKTPVYQWKTEWTRCQNRWGPYLEDTYNAICVDNEWTVVEDAYCKEEKPVFDCNYTDERILPTIVDSLPQESLLVYLKVQPKLQQKSNLLQQLLSPLQLNLQD